MGTTAVAGRNSSATVKARFSTMLRMNRFRLPMRSANELETATPISSEVSPKPLNRKQPFVSRTILEKGQHHAAAYRDRHEIEGGHQEQRDQRPVSEKILHVRPHRTLLRGVGLNPLLRRGEGDDEEDNA